ncbi:hypothetical protein Tco_0687684 [Tanacetum coccineum]
MCLKDTLLRSDVHNDLYEALQIVIRVRLFTNQQHHSTLVGAFGAPGTSGASWSSQLPPPPPPPPLSTAKGLGTHKLSPTDYLMQNDSIPEEKVLLSDDEDSENDHHPKLCEDGDMTILNGNYRQVNKTTLTQADFEGQAYEVVKAFYPDVIHIQFQMEEYHKMLTDQVDWANPEGDQVRINVNRPLPLCDIS